MPTRDNEIFFILKHTFDCIIFKEDVIKHFSNPYRAKFYIDLGQSLFFLSLSTYTLRILRGLPNSSSSFEKLQPPESFLKCLAALASCFSHNSPPCFKANFQTSHTSFPAIVSTQLNWRLTFYGRSEMPNVVWKLKDKIQGIFQPLIICFYITTDRNKNYWSAKTDYVLIS